MLPCVGCQSPNCRSATGPLTEWYFLEVAWGHALVRDGPHKGGRTWVRCDRGDLLPRPKRSRLSDVPQQLAIADGILDHLALHYLHRDVAKMVMHYANYRDGFKCLELRQLQLKDVQQHVFHSLEGL